MCYPAASVLYIHEYSTLMTVSLRQLLKLRSTLHTYYYYYFFIIIVSRHF